jgi:hypothetical protein
LAWKDRGGFGGGGHVRLPVLVKPRYTTFRNSQAILRCFVFFFRPPCYPSLAGLSAGWRIGMVHQDWAIPALVFWSQGVAIAAWEFGRWLRLGGDKTIARSLKVRLNRPGTDKGLSEK